jgi:hypothetical protein
LIGAVGLGLFLIGFLLIGFRRTVAHNFDFLLQVDSPAAWKFLRREQNNDGGSGHCKWRI